MKYEITYGVRPRKLVGPNEYEIIPDAPLVIKTKMFTSASSRTSKLVRYFLRKNEDAVKVFNITLIRR